MLIKPSMRLNSSNAADTAALSTSRFSPQTVIVTKVPRSGSLRRTSSRLGCGAWQPASSQQPRPHHQLKSRQLTPDAVDDVAARNGGTADVINVLIEFEFRRGGLSLELRAPLRLLDFASVMLAIFKYFDLQHLAFTRNRDCVIDQFMFAHYLIDHQNPDRVRVLPCDT